MQINPVIEAIYAAFKIEIANPCFFTENALVLTFPDQTRAVIHAQQVYPTPTVKDIIQVMPNLNQNHTFHYLYQSNLDADRQLLTLQNIEECRTYIADICENLLNVINRDFEIEFSDGTRILITIDLV